MVCLAIYAASRLVYDVLLLCLFVFLVRLVSYQVFVTRVLIYDTYILVVRGMKRNKDAVWSLVLLLVTGVRADPKFSYSYDTICMYIHEECYF